MQRHEKPETKSYSSIQGILAYKAVPPITSGYEEADLSRERIQGRAIRTI